MREALIVMAITGCRQEELQFARLVKTAPGYLTVSVSSVKALRGTRRGGSFARTEYVECLAKLAVEDEGVEHYPFELISPKRIENLLAGLSRKKSVCQKLGRTVSATAFRNQAASDAKAAGFTDEELAIFLGHITNSEQRTYGRAKYAATGSRIALPVSLIDSHRVKVIEMKFKRKAEIEGRQTSDKDGHQA
jgi:hypothetical protein